MFSIPPFNDPLIKETRDMRWFFWSLQQRLSRMRGLSRTQSIVYLVGAARVAFIDGNQGTMSRVLSIEVPRRV